MPEFDINKILRSIRNIGTTDRTDQGSFNTAFKNANEAGDNEFLWKGKRYSTVKRGEFPNEDTQNFFNKLKRETNQEEYDTVLDMYHERRSPSVSITNNRGMYNTMDGRSSINAFRDEITMRPKNKGTQPMTKSLIAELSHIEPTRLETIKNNIKYLGTDLIPQIKYSLDSNTKDNPYKTEGTVEHETHSIIEPKLMNRLDRVRKKQTLDRNRTIDSLYSNIQKAVYDHGQYTPEHNNALKSFTDGFSLLNERTKKLK